ncbi:MAG: alpha/beta hydrolase [Clostridiaceae bacterium]|nr:alpha/beta hydrolase [Clostridiaceae bacterium]
MPFGNNIYVWVAITLIAVVVLTLGVTLALYVFALKSFHKIFDRPYPRMPYDKSPLKIKQDTIYGVGKNWFYTNRNNFMDIQMTSFDDLKLYAYYRPADHKDSDQLIVLVHGWRDHPSDMGAYAQMYLKIKDSHILIPHLRAHGMSRGKHVGFGLYDSQDLIMWIALMEKRLNRKLKIIIHGRSMGASAALMAAGSMKISEGVKGVVADSPFDTLENQIGFVLKKRYRVSPRFMVKAIGRIAASRIGFPVKRASVVAVASKIKTPVLMFHGTEDTFVLPEMSEEIYNRIRSPKRLLMIDGSSHIMAFNDRPSTYVAEVEKFMKVCKLSV